MNTPQTKLAALAALALLACVRATDAQITTTYHLNLNPGTSAGNPITNIMIFEASADGSQLLIDYGGNPNGYSLPGSGWVTLSHASAFNPAMSFIVGITQQVDKLSLVMFVNDAWAANAAGSNFNPLFFSITHNALISRLKLAESGSQADLDWFRNVFWPADGSRAAFATGGSHKAMEFTIGIIIGQVPEPGSTAVLLGLTCAVLFTVRRRLP